LAQASTNEITGTRAGVAVRVQTGNGLSQFSAVQSVEAQIVSAEFELATNEREIRELMRTDYLTYISGLNRALASERVSRSSELVTESYKRQFITGRRGWLDVMNAVRESMTAKLTEADAEIGTLAAYSRLMLRSCIWRPTPIAMEDN
jgi:adhesin transport system outer membrane protein